MGRPALRSDEGCPWDREQTPQSFHPYILEEYHEMVQAMHDGGAGEITDEMGDLLFLVVFVAYMFEQQGTTTLKRIFEGVMEKMIRRHPHVFGGVEVQSSGEVIDNWRKIKASEAGIRQRASLLDGIPRSLPALSRAQKLAKRAARVGFDWNQPQHVFAKVDEELQELKEAAAHEAPSRVREELGDLLFVTVNLARHLGIDSESALNETSDKFERRFRYIEEKLRSQGTSLEDVDLHRMDELWDEAKSLEQRLRRQEDD
ncbi:MAG: nucleoside triphosphate pyrophosphohydrolase [Deltaproteobacteria bacterium]